VSCTIREATEQDLPRIREIYNQGIEDRIATLEEETKTLEEMREWFHGRPSRYPVVVAEQEEEVVGWASLNPYSHRCAYAGVADLSVYVDRAWRGKGIGSKLLKALEEKAKENGFYKLVLFTFPFNQMGQRLYRKHGFREVGVFENQGVLDGRFVDVMAMEKMLVDVEKGAP
jgi:L-amino acid N-acyltransferase YncA